MANNTYKGEITLIKIQDGQNGASISGVVDFYKLGQEVDSIPYVPEFSNTIEQIIVDYGWSTNIPEGLGKENPVVWNFKRTEYDNGKVEHSEAVVASFWATAPEVQARYCATQETDINKWEEIYDDLKHNYIIFSYDNGQTWTPTGGIRIKGKISVDEEAVLYNIIASQDEILRYVDTVSKETYFSPGIIEFQIQREYLGLTDIVDLVDSFSTEETENKFIPTLNCNLVSFADLSKKVDLNVLFESEGTVENPILEYNYNEDKITLNFGLLYQKILQKDRENIDIINNNEPYAQALRILNNVESFLEITVNLVDSFNETKQIRKKYTIRYSTSYDLAQLSIYAGGIVQSVQDTKLVFDAEGLTVYNGGIKIYGDKYILAEPTAENFNNHNYYILTEQGYIEQTEFIEGLTYYEKQHYKVFGLDEFGNLYVKGTGEFTGKIIAKEGEFRGEVRAKSGSLENLTVNGTLTVSGNDGTEIKIQGLYSPIDNVEANDGNLYYYNSERKSIEKYESDQIVPGYEYYIKSENPGIYSNNFVKNGANGFWLDPSTGQIQANSIILGKGATIYDSIYFSSEDGSSFGAIYNPNKHKGVFIETGYLQDESNQGTLKITTEGNIYAGDYSNSNYIAIKGQEGIIQSGNYISGATGWKIDNFSAEFNDIIARGTLKAVTFEQNEVSTVGGALLLRPSSIIKNAQYNTEDRTQVVLTLETPEIVFKQKEEQDYYFRIGTSRIAYIHVSENILDDGTTKVVIRKYNNSSFETIENFVGQILIGYGAEGDIGIGLNSSNSSTAMPPQAITVFETVIDKLNKEGYISENPRIILGKISDEQTYGLEKYGLYADQVNVKGELTSKGNGYYSGINSNSEISMSKISDVETGKIIFWAGAKYDSSFTKEEIAKSIQEAPFQIDTLGNIYASSGYFQGEIHGSTISTSILKTAIIEGNGPLSDENSAALVIRNAFKGIDFEDTLQLSGKEMTLGVPLNFREGNTIIDGEKISTSTIQISNIALNNSLISIQTDESEHLKFLYDSNPIITIQPNGFYSEQNAYLNKNIYFGSEKMEYRQVIVEENILGYDLYIKS